MRRLILIVEDESAIRDMISFALEPAGFSILEATTTQEAEKILQQELPDLILLDWMLPGQSGVSYIKQLKKETRTKSIPIIMLTARAEEHNKITGLEVGADDYITKPFSPRELIARINTVLRRGGAISPDNQIQFDELIIDMNTRKVSIANELIKLTPIEYKLLYFLITHPNRVYTRAELLDHVWPNQTDITERTVDTQIRRLRDQLKIKNYDHYIKTTRGVGYQFSKDKK